MRLISLLLSTMIFTLVLDMIWIAGIAQSLYDHHLGMLLRKSGEQMTPIWWAALLVYLCIGLGIILLIVPKAQGSYVMALLWGALFGIVTYGLYDFTNYSIINHWPLKITLIDFLWGTFLCSISSLFATFVDQRFFV